MDYPREFCISVAYLDSGSSRLSGMGDSEATTFSGTNGSDGVSNEKYLLVFYVNT